MQCPPLTPSSRSLFLRITREITVVFTARSVEFFMTPQPVAALRGGGATLLAALGGCGALCTILYHTILRL